MSGNVYEWVCDLYGRYSIGSQSDPTGVTESSHRVLHGGYSYGTERLVRVSNRDNRVPSDQSYSIGFRLRKLSE